MNRKSFVIVDRRVCVTVERPLPRLLVSANDTALMILPDDGQSFELVHAPIISLCYIAHDNSYYWIDHTRRLVAAHLDSNRTVLQVCVMLSMLLPVSWYHHKVLCYYWRQFRTGISLLFSCTIMFNCLRFALCLSLAVLYGRRFTSFTLLFSHFKFSKHETDLRTK